MKQATKHYNLIKLYRQQSSDGPIGSNAPVAAVGALLVVKK